MKNKTEERQRSQFMPIFVIAALALMLLPFLTTFNSLLTNILLKWKLYVILQEFYVPYQAKMLASILAFFPVSVQAVKTGLWLNGGFISLEWNCLGWQSLVLFLATIFTGFQGNFTRVSRFEVILIGILGTYFVNILRILTVVVLAAFGAYGPAVFFHDYLSLIMTILWFFGLWWFAYSYVLEERDVKNQIA